VIDFAMTLLCMRLGTGPSGTTLEACILCDGSPLSQANIWSRSAFVGCRWTGADCDGLHWLWLGGKLPMAEPTDPHVIKLVRELDAERTRRIKAERLAGTLRTTLARMQKQRTADAAKRLPEQRPAC
jgi:hypothetical protein